MQGVNQSRDRNHSILIKPRTDLRATCNGQPWRCQSTRRLEPLVRVGVFNRNTPARKCQFGSANFASPLLIANLTGMRCVGKIGTTGLPSFDNANHSLARVCVAVPGHRRNGHGLCLRGLSSFKTGHSILQLREPGAYHLKRRAMGQHRSYLEEKQSWLLAKRSLELTWAPRTR